MNQRLASIGVDGSAERVLSVLIVDDNRASLLSLEDLVLLSGHRPFPVSTPGAAIEIAGRERLDLAFIDYQLPDMNGVELIRRLRMLVPDVRYALISGYSAVCLPDAGREAAATAWFRKPLKVDPILEFIDRVRLDGKAFADGL